MPPIGVLPLEAPCRHTPLPQRSAPLALLLGLLIVNVPRSAAEPLATAAKPLLARPADKPGAYVRLGVGNDWPQSSSFSDQNCSSQQPPALFGCGQGNNSQPLGSSGNFDPSPVADVALGYRINSWMRTEALLSWRQDMDFSGHSNFVTAGPNQPVSGSVSSLAGFGVAYVDLPKMGTIRPFLGAGLGVARNRMGAMTYTFPALGASASTTTPGGTSSDLAYLLTAGISVPLGTRVDLDLAYRFTSLGEVQTASGQAEVVRTAGTRSIAIGGTKADLQTHGVMLSLRYAF